MVRLATLVKARPYDGFEHFSTWAGLEQVIRGAGGEIVRRKGLHLMPFQLPIKRLLTWCDEHLQVLRPLMINICLLAQKGGR